MASETTNDSKGPRLAEQLPHYLKEETIGFSSSTIPGADVVVDFMEKFCLPEDHAEIKKAASRKFILAKFKVKPDTNIVPRCKKTHLSLREKRSLGLYSLPRKGLKYQEYLKLNELWKQYMLDSLDFHRYSSKKSKREMNIEDNNWEQFSAQLYKADYHGALMTVVRSKCPSHVGIQGIVVMDTKNTFKILGNDNILRTVPKESSVFQLLIDQFKVTIYGRHLCIKSAERITKKIRNCFVADL